MMVLVDTSVWSLALRRQPKHLSEVQATIREELDELVREGRSQLIGPIRQEVLSGIRDRQQFERLRDYLRTFPDAELKTEDFENAAQASNSCLAASIAVTNVDLLICAVAIRRGWEILTIDKDFQHYARVLPLHLRAVPR